MNPASTRILVFIIGFVFFCGLFEIIFYNDLTADTLRNYDLKCYEPNSNCPTLSATESSTITSMITNVLTKTLNFLDNIPVINLVTPLLRLSFLSLTSPTQVPVWYTLITSFFAVFISIAIYSLLRES